MADKIIRERHQGNISVSNELFEYEGKTYKGACFIIILKFTGV
jgi:signal transduction histidine kinase